jgi:hypothetical protein
MDNQERKPLTDIEKYEAKRQMGRYSKKEGE